ncbi:hypothetical protein HAX54_016257 [Datura stramonium]|uniref:Uncharacterized protein n=1 Tax=Datura stramonium TaxID=4076 RepID=A0ABS8UIN8_DATST|nr:hypothetical protein [Datura stramonium]
MESIGLLMTCPMSPYLEQELDKREKGIKVTYCPDLITDDAADTGISLILAVLRRICHCDRYVKSGLWKKNGDYMLTTKVHIRVGLVLDSSSMALTAAITENKFIIS